MSPVMQNWSCFWKKYECNFLTLQIYNEAEKCLKTLSDWLGESEYFFGNRPSSFDAIVFAYLAPLVKAPFPNGTLSNHVKGIVNLTRFVARINQKNFRHVTDGNFSHQLILHIISHMPALIQKDTKNKKKSVSQSLPW